MADYADAQDVLDRWEGDADPATIETHLGDAERELRRLAPGLDGRVSAGTVDAEDVRYVLVKAVRRYLRNPEGLTYESAGDRAVNRGTGTSPATAGEIVFTGAELGLVRAAPDTTSAGRGTVRTPRPLVVPARYWEGGR